MNDVHQINIYDPKCPKTFEETQIRLLRIILRQMSDLNNDLMKIHGDRHSKKLIDLTNLNIATKTVNEMADAIESMVQQMPKEEDNGECHKPK